MQDNDDKLFDQAFVDHSWGEMKKLLDKELPVRQGPRRLLWLLALGFLVLTVAGWLFGPTSNLDRPMASPDLPVADQQFLSPDDLTTISSDPTTVPNKSTNPTHPITPDRFNIRQAEKNNDQPKPNNADLTSIPQMNNQTISNQHPTTNIQHPISNNQQPTTNPASSGTGYPTSNNPHVALAFLESNDKELEWPLRETPPFFEFKSNIRPTATNWNWGVQASVLSAKLPDQSGWSIGVWGQRPRFLSPRLSLRFGLLYQMENRSPYGAPSAGNEVGLSAENMDPTLSFPSGRQQDTLSAQAVAELLELNISQYQLPLEIQWRATAKLSVFSGVRLSYREASIKSQQEGPSNTFSSNTYAAPEYDRILAVDRGNSLPEEFVDHWDLAVHMGLSYKIMPRLEAVMSYQYGLNNLFRRIDLELYNRNASIGLMYRIQN